MDGLTQSDCLRTELNLKSRVCCRLVGGGGNGDAAVVQEGAALHIEGVVLNSLLHKDSIVPKRAIVENSIIRHKVM